eukprot:975198-Pyramimonas_sp.AAC.1
MTNAPERRVGTGPFGQLKQLEASTAGGAAANAKRCWWEMSVTDERGWARGGLRLRALAQKHFVGRGRLVLPAAQ